MNIFFGKRTSQYKTVFWKKKSFIFYNRKYTMSIFTIVYLR